MRHGFGAPRVSGTYQAQYTGTSDKAERGEIVPEAVETLHLGDVLRPSFKCGWCRFADQGKR